MSLGERLRQARESKGWTQVYVAKLLGITSQALSNYERGERDPDTPLLNRLAELYGVSADWLLGRTDDPSINRDQENKATKRFKTALQAIKDFLLDEKGGAIEHPNIPTLLNILSLIAGTGPMYPKIELADILDNEDVILTEGGEPLSPDKRRRLIEAIMAPNNLSKTRTIPILGQIRAGLPILAEENYEGGIEIPSDITADFALRVRGDSMIGAGILDGDYAICRKAETINAHSGQIVVAVRYEAAEYAEATLKYFFENNGHPVLRAANPEYEDIDFEGEGYRVVGVMVALLRYRAPDYDIYRNYISTRDFTLREWDDVIDKATAAGIKASVIKELIDVQIEIAKRLKG